MATPIKTMIQHRSTMVAKLDNQQQAPVNNKLFKGVKFGNIFNAPPPQKLAVFHPQSQKMVLTDIEAKEKKALDGAKLTGVNVFTQKELTTAKKILTAIGINANQLQLSPQQTVLAGKMISKNQVSTAWMAANIRGIKQNSDTAVVGSMLFRLHERSALETQSGIQDAWSTYNTRFTQEVAGLLVDGHGNLSVTRAEILKDQLTSDNSNIPKPQGIHKDQVIAILDKIITDEGFRNAFNNVQQPGDHGGRVLVNRTLGLPKNATPSKSQAQQAILSAMMTPMRQGKVGNCFGCAVGSQIQQMQPTKMFNMLKDMVNSGKMTLTKPPNVTIDMPVNQSVQGSSFTQKIEVFKDHTVRAPNGTKQPLLQLEGFKRALNSLGIQNPGQAAETAMETLGGRYIPGKVTPQQIFETIMNAQPNQTKQSIKTALTNAAHAFHGAEENSLLRSFEYTLTDFNEAVLAGGARNAFENAFDSAMAELFPLQSLKFREALAVDKDTNLPLFTEPEQNFLTTQFSNISRTLNDQIKDNYRVVYDASLSQHGLADDGSSEFGGFRILLKEKDGSFTKLENKGQMEDFLLRMMTNTQTQILTTLETATIGQNQEKVSEKVKTKVQDWLLDFSDKIQNGSSQSGKTFIEATLTAASLDRGQELGFFEAADPEPVLQFAFGQQNLSSAKLSKLKDNDPVRTYRDARDLLKFTTQTVRTMHNRMKGGQSGYVQKDLAKLSLPVNNNVHAFRLMPGLDSRFKDVWSDDSVDIDTWIKTTLNVDEMDTLSDKLTMSGDEAKQFLKPFAGKLKDTPANIVNGMGNQIKAKDLLKKVFENFQPQVKNENNYNDLMQALFKKFKNDIDPPLKPLVLFDSNWGDSSNRKLLGVIHNPISGESEVWTLDQKGKDAPVTLSAPEPRDEFANGYLKIFNETKQLGYT